MGVTSFDREVTQTDVSPIMMVPKTALPHTQSHLIKMPLKYSC